MLSPAIGMTLYGPNWNGVKWEQNTTKGDDALAALLYSASPTAAKTFKIIFIVSGTDSITFKLIVINNVVSACLWGLILCLGVGFFAYRSYIFKRFQE